MATFGIESNGMIETTAIYYNGQQVGGVKEVFINIDENGTFDGIIQYEGSDKQIHTKQIFSDYLTNIRVVEPSFTEEDAAMLRLIEVESSGTIEDAIVYQDEEAVDGIVSLFIHMKSAEKNTKGALSKLFSGRKEIPDEPEFRAEITFRYDDDSIETEAIF